MKLRLVLLLALLTLGSQATYEDQFGKVYDWKKTGISSPVETVFFKDSILLLSKDGFSLVDHHGINHLI